MTPSVRAELAGQGTRVVAVLPGFVATRMTTGLEVPKAQPAEVVEAALAALASGPEDVYPDAPARGWLEQVVTGYADHLHGLTAA